MRLVDADKQFEWVDCMTPIHGIGLEPVVAVETVRDLIRGAPTIDAIPVEWLNKKRDSETLAMFSNIYGRGDKDIVHSIHKVLELWRKEQEEQNG